jgi:copper homeostasis protein
MKIEICLEDAASVIAAEKGGADRVEFCADLFEGGTTPSLGMFLAAKKHASIPMNVMIRPRGGDFCYSDIEFEAMKEDVKVFKAHGANAIVFGILTPDGEIDVKRSEELIALARPLPVTFHRAFDMTRDAFRSLDTLIGMGVDRLLTSGMEPTVMDGMETLAQLVRKAGDKIVVMPGCGITERNFAYLDEHIHAKEYHVFLPKEYDSKMTYRPGYIYMGGMLRQPEFFINHTDAERVAGIVGMKK